MQCIYISTDPSCQQTPTTMSFNVSTGLLASLQLSRSDFYHKPYPSKFSINNSRDCLDSLVNKRFTKSTETGLLFWTELLAFLGAQNEAMKPAQTSQNDETANGDDAAWLKGEVDRACFANSQARSYQG